MGVLPTELGALGMSYRAADLWVESKLSRQNDLPRNSGLLLGDKVWDFDFPQLATFLTCCKLWASELVSQS